MPSRRKDLAFLGIGIVTPGLRATEESLKRAKEEAADLAKALGAAQTQLSITAKTLTFDQAEEGKKRIEDLNKALKEQKEFSRSSRGQLQEHAPDPGSGRSGTEALRRLGQRSSGNIPGYGEGSGRNQRARPGAPGEITRNRRHGRSDRDRAWRRMRRRPRRSSRSTAKDSRGIRRSGSSSRTSVMP